MRLMRCPNCGHEEDRVLDTRVVKDGAAIRRRRECLLCTHRFTTYEYVEAGTFQVVKKDGRREAFAREKLMHGLAQACEKRPISATVIEELADRIETELARLGKSEVRSSDVGARVLRELRTLDPVAYVRFASVYLNFSDIRQFLDTIHDLPAAGPGTENGVPDATGDAPVAADAPAAPDTANAPDTAKAPTTDLGERDA
jgi:transcriptional repressor NrdR